MSREKTLPPVARELMVRALAAFETPWRPTRGDQHAAGQIHIWRHSAKLLYRSGRASAAQRESASHWAAELCERNLMLKSGHLTPRGRQLARSWVWPFTAAELRAAVRRLLAAVEAGDVHPDINGGLDFVPEEIIAGEYWGPQNALLQNLFLPWLADQVLVCECEASSGCAFYAIADRNSNLSPLASKVIDSREEFSEELGDYYRAEASNARNAMLADKPGGEIGSCGLAMTELRSGRDYLAPGALKSIKPIFKLSNG